MAGYIIAIFAIIIILKLLTDAQKAKKNTEQKQPEPVIEVEPEGNIEYKYQKKWLFTMNEKEVYRKIKTVTDDINMILLSKVRLFDLVEPQKGQAHYKSAQYKIQAKHVDFVVCDQKLVARTIIELDDNSHNATARKNRDEFVDDILKKAGYKVIRIRAINEVELKNILTSTL